MSHLLLKSVFDHFLLSEMEIQTYGRFLVSGRLNQSWYTKEEWELLNGRKYAVWGDIKSFAYQLIKGNKTPLSLKLVFVLSVEETGKIVEKTGKDYNTDDVDGLFLNLHYEKDALHLVTGTSLKLFTLDKGLEHAWDDWVKQFLAENGIPAEQL